MQKKSSPVPWAILMKFGFGQLRLSSRQFWDMTPREILAASGYGLDHGSNGDRMDRQTLSEMERAYPDLKQKS